jgi:hypothetical protein
MPELFPCLRHDTVDVTTLGDVTLQRDGACAEPRHQAVGGLGAASIIDDDARALAPEGRGDGGAKTAAGAGNQNYLIAKFHARLREREPVLLGMIGSKR